MSSKVQREEGDPSRNQGYASAAGSFFYRYRKNWGSEELGQVGGRPSIARLQIEEASGSVGGLGVMM